MLKKAGKIIGIYLAIYCVCSVVFVGLFHTPILKGLEVLMYRGIVFIVIGGLLAAIAMFFCKRKWKNLFDIKDVILIFLGFCSVNMVLFTLIPVTVERSVSVFTLSYMEENPKAYTSRNAPADRSRYSHRRCCSGLAVPQTRHYSRFAARNPR